MEHKEIWISFLNENNETIQGYFQLLEQTQSYVKIQSAKGNVFLLPYHKINKIKERLEK